MIHWLLSVLLSLLALMWFSGRRWLPAVLFSVTNWLEQLLCVCKLYTQITQNWVLTMPLTQSHSVLCAAGHSSVQQAAALLCGCDCVTVRNTGILMGWQQCVWLLSLYSQWAVHMLQSATGCVLPSVFSLQQVFMGFIWADSSEALCVNIYHGECITWCECIPLSTVQYW